MNHESRMPQTSVHILLRTPFDGPWLSLRDPSALITAWEPGDVRRCLDEAERACRKGFYAAGFVTYEYDECQIKAAILTKRELPFRLLETLKWEPESRFVLLDRHLDRLHRSADYFAFRVPIVDVRATLERALSGRVRAAKVRVLLAQDGEVDCEVLDLGSAYECPLRVALAASPVSAGDVFLRFRRYSGAEEEMAGVGGIGSWS